MEFTSEIYEKPFDFSLLPNLPIIIRVNGRSFKRLCRNLKKPFDPSILDAMVHSMAYTVSEIPGAIFGFQYSDKLIIVIKNTKDLWNQNKIQKIGTQVASMVTMSFNKYIDSVDLDLIGDAIFDGFAFSVPSINEVIDCIVENQRYCFKFAVDSIYSAQNKKKLAFKDKLGKIEDFDSFANSFRLGVATYKSPVIFNNKTRNKWKLDWEIPNFSIEGRDFLYTIISTGKDIFRQEGLE